MKRDLLLILTLIVAVCATTTTHAQEGEQAYYDGRLVDAKIHFQYDDYSIDPTYMDNSTSLHIVDSLLNDTEYISTLRRIEITAQSSPEGRIEHNEQLTEQRRLSLEEYFTTKYPQIPASLWSFQAIAENWDLFYSKLVEDENLPHREQILTILNGERDNDAKEWLIKKIDGGMPWLYIKENILPSLRFGASVLFIPITDQSTPTVEEPTSQEQATAQTTTREEHVRCVSPKKEKGNNALLAIKTNLLLDAVSAVNIAIEVPIGDRLSVVGEFTHPWWRSWPKNFTMQIESYHGELKYWLGDRSQKERLAGWSAGVYGGWGEYDLQPFSEKGVQGEFYDAGIQVGYAHSIAKNLNLEYTIGAGYTSSDYNKYYMAYDTKSHGDVKVLTNPRAESRLRAVLPTRCAVSLVWLIR